MAIANPVFRPMQLIGMLDSPYVRRVAISLKRLNIPFEHQSISVFRQVEDFSQINPLVRAPSLVCDDGTVLADSTLILEYVEQLAGPDQSLMPSALGDYRQALCLIGLALNACDKTVHCQYERNRLKNSTRPGLTGSAASSILPTPCSKKKLPTVQCG